MNERSRMAKQMFDWLNKIIFIVSKETFVVTEYSFHQNKTLH